MRLLPRNVGSLVDGKGTAWFYLFHCFGSRWLRVGSEDGRG